MAEDQTTAPAETEALDDEFVEWHDENGNRCRGSRFGSAYKDFVLKWLAAEADHKAINGLPAEPVQRRWYSRLLRSPLFWLVAIGFGALAFAAACSDSISVGGGGSRIVVARPATATTSGSANSGSPERR